MDTNKLTEKHKGKKMKPLTLKKLILGITLAVTAGIFLCPGEAFAAETYVFSDKWENILIDPDHGIDGHNRNFTAYIQPVASFTAYPIAVAVSEIVQFTDTSSGKKDGSAGDIDTWSWTFGDGNTSTLQNPTHAYVSGGTYNVTLTVEGPDPLLPSISPAFQITVNEAPTAVINPTIATINENETINLDGLSSTDPGGGSITGYAWNIVADIGTVTHDFDDEGWVVDSSTTFTPPLPTDPEYLAPNILQANVTLQVMDNSSAPSANTAPAVITVNRAPDATPSGPSIIDEGDQGVALSANGDDRDTADIPGLTYAWEVSSNATNISDLNLSAADVANPTFDCPNPVQGTDDLITVTFTVTVTDTGGLSVQKSIGPITVNRAPDGSPYADDTIVDEGETLFGLYASPSDPDSSDTLIYTWAVSSTNATNISDANLSDLNAENPTFNCPDPVQGPASVITVTFTVTIDDGRMPVDRNVGPITVNRAPDATPSGPSAIDEGDQGVALSANGDDRDTADIPGLTYAWEVSSNATNISNANLSALDVASPIFNCPDPVQGPASAIDVTFTVTVTDTGGLFAQESIGPITINRAPKVEPPATTVYVNEEDATVNDDVITLNANGNDLDTGDTLIYTWTLVGAAPSEIDLDDPVIFDKTDPEKPVFTCPDIEGPINTATFEVEISDGSLTDTAQIAMTINRHPTANAGSDITVNKGSVAFTLSGVSDDIDGDSLGTYAWTGGSSEVPIECIIPTNVDQPTFDSQYADLTGEAKLIDGNFELTVTEGSRADGLTPLSSTATITIRINRLPIADADAPETTVDEGAQDVQLDGSLSYDPDKIAIANVPGALQAARGIASYAWTEPIALDDPTAEKPTFDVPTSFTDPEGGPVEREFGLVVVGDTAGDPSLEDTVTITINRKPIADAGTYDPVDEGDPVQLNGSGSYDPDKIAITDLPASQTARGIASYEWTVPLEVTDFSDTGAEKPTFTAPDVDKEEQITFGLTVTDSRGISSVASTVIITVLEIVEQDIIYVNKSSSSPNPPDGTEANPFLTIGAALAHAAGDAAVDIIEVIGTDTYTENVNLPPLSLAHGIALRARTIYSHNDNYTGPIIIGNDATDAPTVVLIDGCTLEGFKIENTTGYPAVAAGSNLGAREISKVVICHNTIKATADVGSGTLSALTIENPVETMDGGDPDDIINIHHNIIITRAQGKEAEGRGLVISQPASDTTLIRDQKIRIINNTIDVISDGYTKGLYVDANNNYEPLAANLDTLGIVVRNNIVSIEAGIKEPYWNNFCIYKKPGRTIPDLPSTPNLPVRYNYLYVRHGKIDSTHNENLVHAYYFEQSNLIGVEGNSLEKIGKPLYIDLTAEDFHIHEDASSIDMGCPADDPYSSNLYDLEPDYPNGQINMGAYGNTPEAAIAAANKMATASIISITGGPVQGASKHFKGEGYDPDGTIDPSSGYQWISDKDDFIGDPSASMNYSGLSAGKHTITLKVQDNGGKWSLESDPVEVLVGTPTELEAGPGSVVLTWKDNSTSELGFIVERRESGSDVWYEIASYLTHPGLGLDGDETTSETEGPREWIDFEASDEITYYYQVCAVTAEGEKNYTDTLITKIASDVPYSPFDLEAKTITDEEGLRIELTWKHNTEIAYDGYLIYKDGALLADRPLRVCSDSDVTAGNTYSYKVKTYKQSGATQLRSNSSNIVEVALPSNIEPTVKITSPIRGECVYGSINVDVMAFDNDDKDADALVIKVEYKKGEENWKFLCSDTVAPGELTISWDTTGLPSGNDYSIRVIASDGNRDTYSEFTVEDITVLSNPITVSNVAELNTAVFNAVLGDVILLEAGTYNLTSLLNILEDITLKGINPDETILSLGSYHISVSSSSTVTLDGLTIRDYNASDAKRGPIQNSGTLTLKNCKVIYNRGIKVSGVSCLDSSSVLYLDNTLIAKNTNILADVNSSNYGEPDSGGNFYSGVIVLAPSAELYITDSTIVDNVNQLGPLVIRYAAIQQHENSPIQIDHTIMWNNGSSEDFCVWEGLAPLGRIVESSDIQQSDVDGQEVIHEEPIFVDTAVDNYNVNTNWEPSNEKEIGSYLAVPPVANFTTYPRIAADLFTVYFIDLSAGDIAGWMWDFGDGTQSSEQFPRHTYAAFGTYDVALTVTGPGGSDMETKEITISYLPSAADFTADVTIGEVPLRVNFTDTSTGSVTSWSWDFGDGYTSTAQHSSHTYITPGSYTVSLATTGPGGADIETKDSYITSTPQGDIRLDTDMHGTAYSYYPQISSDDNGNVYAVWYDYRDGKYGIYFNYSRDFGATWQTQKDIRLDKDTSGTVRSYYPQISSDDNGNVYVTWYAYRDGKYGIYFNYSRNFGDSDSWHTQEDIRLDKDTSGTVRSYYPQISSDDNGNVYVTWYAYRDGKYNIYFNYSRNFGATWQIQDIRIDKDTSGTARSYQPQISSDDNGNVYVTWYAYRDGKYGIYFNYSRNFGDSDSWHTQEDIRLDKDTSGTVRSYYPQISSDDNGNVYVTWYAYRDGKYNIYFNYSRNFGATWQTQKDIRLDKDTPGAAYLYYPQISSDDNGNVYVTWYDYRSSRGDIYLNYSSDFGASWQTQDIRLDTDTPGAASSYYPQISSDDNGNVYVAWYDYRNGGSDIYLNYSSDFGASWQAQDIRLDTDTPGAAYSYYPQIASDDYGNVYTVWMDCRDGRYDVYFNRVVVDTVCLSHIEDQVVLEGELLEFTISAANTRGTLLEFMWYPQYISNQDLRPIIESEAYLEEEVFDWDTGQTTATLTWRPGLDSAGTYYPIYFVVRDPETGRYDFQVITIEVAGEKPVSIIQNAINEAQPGDTVYIEPGIYSFDVEPFLGQNFESPLSVVYSRSLMINKNITLKAIDPDPDNTVIRLYRRGFGGRCIVIMDPYYYLGSHIYSRRGFETVNDVTIEGITIDEKCRGSESIKIWISYTQPKCYGTGDGRYCVDGHWALFTSSGITSPIYNFSERLTLRNCKILSTNSKGYSIYTWPYDTELILDNTHVEGDIKRDRRRRSYIHYNEVSVTIRYIYL